MENTNKTLIPRVDSALELQLSRSGIAVPAMIGLAAGGAAEWEVEARQWLHSNELKRLEGLVHAPRRQSFLLGRRAAKNALSRLLNRTDSSTIEIRPGVFGFPLVSANDSRNPQVSVSHSGGWGIAVAFFDDHPMGLDIERVDPDRTPTILSSAGDEEKELLSTLQLGEDEAATVYWTLKESLSKILRTGLMTPLSVYELARIEPTGEGAWTGHFRNFPQYRGVAWSMQGYVCSLALPRRTEIESGLPFGGISSF